jgi:hypothetical protein
MTECHQYLHKSTEVMANWTVLEDKFISQFYPQGKVQDAMTAIPMFYQKQLKPSVKHMGVL